jgi:hypothetical protein
MSFMPNQNTSIKGMRKSVKATSEATEIMQPYLRRKANVIYLRKKVPVDLRQHFDGKREIAISLKTEDRKEAAKRARLELAKIEERFEQLRNPVPTVEERLAKLRQKYPPKPWGDEHLRYRIHSRGIAERAKEPNDERERRER